VGKMVPNRQVQVTEQGHREGIDRTNGICAISEAVKRTTPGARRVLVNKNRISYTLETRRITYPTPEAAIEAVIRPFDLVNR